MNGEVGCAIIAQRVKFAFQPLLSSIRANWDFLVTVKIPEDWSTTTHPPSLWTKNLEEKDGQRQLLYYVSLIRACNKVLDKLVYIGKKFVFLKKNLGI